MDREWLDAVAAAFWQSSVAIGFAIFFALWGLALAAGTIYEVFWVWPEVDKQRKHGIKE